MSFSHFPPVTLALLLFKYGSMLFCQGYPIDAPSSVHSPSSAVSFFIFLVLKLSSAVSLAPCLIQVLSCVIFLVLFSQAIYLKLSPLIMNQTPFHSTRHHLIYHCESSALDYKLKKAGIFVCYIDCHICSMME